MSEPYKRKRGDRRDGRRITDGDSMHNFTPYLLPNRTDNEAVAVEKIDLTQATAYIDAKNRENPEFKYTLFHFITAAFAKVITLRPKMNRFIIGRRTYERNEISFAFVVKKKFTDDGREALAILRTDRDSDEPIIKQIHDKICKFVYGVRKEDKSDGSTDVMDIITKFPRWLLQLFTNIIFRLDFHGHLPQALSDVDPYACTMFISNLGSIKMSASYHHLTNWGTNSIFLVIGEKHKEPFFEDDGSYEMRDSLNLGITIDERIADGVYFAKSIRLVKYIFAHPELLDAPALEPIDMKDI